MVTRLPVVRRVSAGRPFVWLRLAWDDFAHYRMVSLAYGLMVMLGGLLIYSIIGPHPYILAAAASGFMLLGPVLAAGLCALSRARKQGQQIGFDGSLDALDSHRPALLGFGVTLFLLAGCWFAASAAVLGSVLGEAAPSFSASLWGDPWAAVTHPQIAAYFGIGGALAGVIFIISVVAVPAMIDRGCTYAAAMRLSASSVAANLPASIVWASLIVLLSALGFLTGLVGLLVVFPLLGHATWHAYVDMVGVRAGSEDRPAVGKKNRTRLQTRPVAGAR